MPRGYEYQDRTDPDHKAIPLATIEAEMREFVDYDGDEDLEGLTSFSGVMMLMNHGGSHLDDRAMRNPFWLMPYAVEASTSTSKNKRRANAMMITLCREFFTRYRFHGWYSGR